MSFVPDVSLFRQLNLSPMFRTTFFFLLAVSNLWAQNPNGTLRGEVQDTSDARIAGATVKATASRASLTREVISNNRGEFRLEGLLPGQYRVAVTAKEMTTT